MLFFTSQCRVSPSTPGVEVETGLRATDNSIVVNLAACVSVVQGHTRRVGVRERTDNVVLEDAAVIRSKATASQFQPVDEKLQFLTVQYSSTVTRQSITVGGSARTYNGKAIKSDVAAVCAYLETCAGGIREVNRDRAVGMAGDRVRGRSTLC